MKRILMVGGGSGGHAMPLLAVAESLQTRAVQTNQAIELFFLGSKGFLENAVRDAGPVKSLDGDHLVELRHEAGGVNWQFRSLVAGKIRRYFSLQLPLDYLKIFAGFWHALWRVFWLMPDLVFAKGGYDSVWPVFWAWVFRIPVYIHDSDAIPGSANRLLAHFAKQIFVAFPGAATYFAGRAVMVTGNPIRPELLRVDHTVGQQTFKLRPELPTVLILGGSQGAQNINNLVLQSVVELTKQWQVIHQVGSASAASVAASVAQIIKEGSGSYGPIVEQNYHPFPFFGVDELVQAYAVADVVVTRGGSASLFEISAVGKPAIIIPIKASANNHQHANALELVKFGAILIEEDNLTQHIFLNQLQHAYQQRAELGQRIKAFAPLDAADKIAAQLLA